MIKCELGYPYFHALIVVSCVFSLYVQYLFYQLFYCCCRYSSTGRLCLRFSSVHVRVCFIQGRLCYFTLLLSASHACPWRHLNPCMGLSRLAYKSSLFPLQENESNDVILARTFSGLRCLRGVKLSSCQKLLSVCNVFWK